MGTVQVSRVSATAGLYGTGSGAGGGTAAIAARSAATFAAAGSGSGVGAATTAVGSMYVPVSRWDMSVVASATEVIRVDVWDGGTLKGTIRPKPTGGVTADFATGPRRSLQATFDPSRGNLLVPGFELRPYRGFDYLSGPLEWEPLGCFPINGLITDVDPAAEISLTCQDRWQWIVSSTFANGYTARPGRRIKEILTELVLDTGMWTAAQVLNTITSNAVATTQVWETDRNQAIADLCQAVGAEAFCDPLGNVVLQDRKAAGASVVTIKAGDGGRMTAGSISVDISDVFNVVVVKPANTDPAFTLAPVTVRIKDPNHPAYPIRGKRVTRPYVLDQGQATSQSQIKAMAQKVLTRISAPARQVSLKCLVDCRLREADTFTVVWPSTGYTERLQIQQISYPFDIEEDQDLVGVSTRSDEDFNP